MVKIPALAAILLLTALNAARAVDVPIADPALYAASGEQRSPAIAGSGADFFAAWADGRSVVYDASVQPSPRPEWDTYGSRIALDGRPDAAGGTAMSATPDIEDTPAVVWNGSEYVAISAAYERLTGASRVIFTRVGPAGPDEGVSVSVPSAFAGPTLGYGSRLVAAWNGRDYLVVIGYSWARLTGDQRSPSVVRGLIVDRDFRVVQPLFTISDPALDSILPSAATDGTSFLVSWAEAAYPASRVRTAVVSASGSVSLQSEPVGELPSYREVPNLFPPRSAWDGERYLVTWSDSNSIYGRFVDRDAAPAGAQFTIAHTDGVGALAPAVAWNGSLFLVSFAYRNEWSAADPQQVPVTNIYATRVRADGTLVDDLYPLTITTAPGEQTVSDVAAAGNVFDVVWSDAGDIYTATVDPVVGKISPADLVTRSVRPQSNEFGVFDGSHFGFLWTEGSDVLFGRMTLDGRRPDGGGRKIADGTAKALLWNGSEYLAVWNAPGVLTDITTRAVRISAGGQLLDASPIELPEGGWVFSTDGVDFLVVTGSPHPRLEWGTVTRMAAYVVRASGEVTPSHLIAPAQFTQAPAGLAWNGSHYVLSYTQYLGDFCYKCFPATEARLLALDRGGQPSGEPVKAAAAGPVAGGGGQTALVYTEFENGGSSQAASRVIVSLPERGISLKLAGTVPLNAPFLLDVAWDGEAFVIEFGDSMYRVSSSGVLLRTEEGAPAAARSAHIIPALGATPLLVRRIDVLPPWHHQGGIERVFLHWSDAPRRRATAHH